MADARRSVFFYTDSRALGGAEHAMFTLIEGLDETAWRSTLLVDSGGVVAPLQQRARTLGVAARLVAPMPLGIGGARRVPGLVRLLRAERPDVFHAHLSWPLAAKYALAASALARVSAVVATVHLIPDFRLDRSSYLQLRALSAGVDRYIAVSRDIATELAERFRWPERKIEVVRNAVAPGRSCSNRSVELRSRLTGGRQRPVILTSARLEQHKGHSVLLRAAVELPEALFVIAGEGPERPSLEAQAAELGIADRILFLGFRSDVPALLEACDVFALPSLYEGTSLAVLEAMGAGRAIVTSAIGGTDELIDDGETGLLVPPGDATALGLALRRLLTDEQLRLALGARARERAIRDFSLTAMVDRVTSIYMELLSGTPRS